jgi:hypothetical protein
MNEHPSSSQHPQPPRRGSAVVAWRWPVVVALLAVLAFLGIRQGLDLLRGAGNATLEGVADIAERFRSGTITTTFTAALPRFAPDDSLKLELAAVEAVETFSRTDDRRVFYDLVPLGTTVSEIRVPVTYRYHVRLDETWHLEVSDHTCLVIAPPIRPTLPPAIDTAGMTKRSSSGWLRFDETERMEDLERQLTRLLSRRAADPDTIDLVRGRCRLRIAEFVRTWLLAEDHWRTDRFRAITVVFADEAAPDPALRPPTLELETTR